MGELVLPSALSGRPFTVREARAAGLRYDRLRRARVPAPTWGVRAPEEPDGLAAKAAAYARGMPGDVAFSHITAARLWKLPLPAPLEEDGLDLDVMRHTGQQRIRRRGCCGHRGLERREVVELDGLRVVGLADTWVDLGEVVARGLGIDDLVVAGDATARQLEMRAIAEALGGPRDSGPHPDDGGSRLLEALNARVRPRGKALLKEALPLVRARSRSAMETRARLMFQRAGFPEPELNVPVRDAQGGWLLEADLYWRRQRVIGEYQGADHASRARRSADSSRTTLAEEHDHRLIEIYSEDVLLGARRRACLRRFARELSLDVAELTIG